MNTKLLKKVRNNTDELLKLLRKSHPHVITEKQTRLKSKQSLKKEINNEDRTNNNH